MRVNAITPGGVESGQNEPSGARYSERVPLDVWRKPTRWSVRSFFLRPTHPATSQARTYCRWRSHRLVGRMQKSGRAGTSDVQKPSLSHRTITDFSRSDAYRRDVHDVVVGAPIPIPREMLSSRAWRRQRLYAAKTDMSGMSTVMNMWIAP